MLPQGSHHRVKDYLALTKPRVTWLIVMSAAIGYFFGHAGHWSFWPVVHALIGPGYRHAHDVPVPVYAAETEELVVYDGGRLSGRDAAPDRLCRGRRQT